MDLLLAPLAIVDLETTGTRPATDRITEIGVLEVERFEVISEWSTLVNPGVAVPSEIEKGRPARLLGRVVLEAEGPTQGGRQPRPTAEAHRGRGTRPTRPDRPDSDRLLGQLSLAEHDAFG